MVQGVGIASFTCNSFYSIDTGLFSSHNENQKSKNLIEKVQNDLRFLSLAFFKLE